MRRDRRAGVTVVEALVALLLTLVTLALVARLAARQRAAGEVLARRSEVVEARRVARDLVDHALTSGTPWKGGGDELQVRSFVGWAVRCPAGGWRYRGRRLPDPARDSLWVVGEAGRVRVTGLEASRGVACAAALPSEEALELDFEGGDGTALVRVFESGRFRLGDALRYGRRGEAAQPLTGAVLDPAVSRIEVGGSTVTMTIRGRGDSSSVSRTWPVHR